MKRVILTIFTILLFGFTSNAQGYLGYVIKTVNFRTEANTNCTVIATLQQGTALFVISKDKNNGFYQVLDIETNKEGFVSANFIKLDKILPRNEQGIFTSTGTTSTEKPVAKIYNNTSKTLTLKLNDKIHYFSPQERKTLTLSSGSYSYRASAPGVIPDYGTELIASNHEYKWSFYISTTSN
ncbi:SH3 domain-containing protein [Cellulophaga baltica]|uniref:SH3b domain-containing protein n=1 Tax=Cellulophaga baltica 18 TaxID=1348584 RepID=A0AAU8RJE3_9FLAO|nr:SH3 domain-containing protein [Cellulophaga baltica]AIZ40456.1 hypothetical protein M666_02010 [Cellulophaga baltica 18]